MKVLLLCLVACLFVVVSAHPTSLTHYVYNYEDGFYGWVLSDSVIEEPDYTCYNLYLTSQKWLTDDEVSDPVWTHWLQVVVPNNLISDSDMGFLYIDGGSNKGFDQPPSSVNSLVSSFAVSTGTIGAGLSQIPNQPVYFAGDPDRGRSEDAMIAYTWSHWINNTLEYDWLARMPMTKASIKAMDAMQEFVQTRNNINNLERFTIAGASKRGWTTWMVGAMDDPRVVAIVPIVAPIANLVPQINEQWQSYGNWSFALADYVEMNLMGWLNLPRFEQMLDIIDPLSYIEELEDLEIYVVVASMDEFFMPDSAKYYWDQLPGDKHLRIVPNADHSLAGHAFDILAGVEQLYMSIYYNNTSELPTYSWEISEDGSTITVTTDTTDNLVEARVYTSQGNPNRDWRAITCDDEISCINIHLFGRQDLTPVSPGVYQYTIPIPTDGTYSAFFIELDYRFDDNAIEQATAFTVTSDLSIVPTTFDYEPCDLATVCGCGYNCANNYYNGFP